MQLERVLVEGYRSIGDPVELYIDGHVTVVLGANDHGKTNLLEALAHLNPDEHFDGERDLNWDRADREDDLPAVSFRLQLDDDERRSLSEMQRLVLEERTLIEEIEACSVATSELENRRIEAKADFDSVAAATTASSATAEPPTEAGGAGDAPQDTGADEAQAVAAREAAEQRLADVDGELAAARRSKLAVKGRLVQIRAMLESLPEETALDQLIQHLERQLSDAEQEAEEASTVSEDAANGLEAGKAQYAEGSTELAALVTASTRATRALSTARQSVGRARERLSEARQQADALDDVGGVAFRTPEMKQEQPSSLRFERRGVEGKLALVEPDDDGWIDGWARPRLPRVQAVTTVGSIRDSVDREELETDAAVFMRGIFHYAGLQSEEWDHIFPQTDRSLRRLERASEALNATLRESWSQGQKLRFQLRHDSAEQRIELVIDDPAVESRVVRASRRSSGFTHFFALKTILHAYEMESPASAFIWLFDEPGVFLHPDGQHDLVQVMETLAQNNQVLYTTHSIFMANKNFPSRHRLVIKAISGTKLDGKPFRSRWRPAIEALGMSLSGSLLFASRVLLVEGDSDSLLLNAMLQKLIALEEFEYDVNSLAIMPAGDSADAAALLRMLSEGATRPQVAALFDGDGGGRERKKALERLGRDDVTIKLLAKDSTTEDHVPIAVDLYPEALAVYLAKLDAEAGHPADEAKIAQYRETLANHIDELQVTGDRLTSGLADWSRKVGREVAKLDAGPSSVGVAREYAALLATADRPPAPQLKRSKELSRWIAETLQLPKLWLEENEILHTEPTDELA